MIIDWISGVIGLLLGYLSIAIVTFAIAFVISKSFNVKWPYTVVIFFNVIVYGLLIAERAYRAG